MGTLHRTLGPAWDPAAPVGIDNYGSPRLSWRLLPISLRLLGPAFYYTAARVRALLREVGRARAVVQDLPRQAVHGDFRIGNAVESPDGSWSYLDFDYANLHERVFDPAYSAYFAAINLGWTVRPDVPWDLLEELLRAYESTAPAPLTAAERHHIPTVMAQVGLYFAAAAGFGNSAESALEDVGIAEWVWRSRAAYVDYAGNRRRENLFFADDRPGPDRACVQGPARDLRSAAMGDGSAAMGDGRPGGRHMEPAIDLTSRATTRLRLRRITAGDLADAHCNPHGPRHKLLPAWRPAHARVEPADGGGAHRGVGRSRHRLLVDRVRGMAYGRLTPPPRRHQDYADQLGLIRVRKVPWFGITETSE